MPKYITMADVAREVGVSLMTVSRVINSKDGVSLPTRLRVLNAIERMGYRPSAIARSLATRQTGTVGLVVPDVADPFFTDVVRGVEQTAYVEDYNVFLCSTDQDPEREWTVLESLEDKRVDGVILCSSRLDDDKLREVLSQHMSVVLVNRRLKGEDSRVNTLLVDNSLGSRLAIRHLLSRGRRAVGVLAGPADSPSGRQRVQSYRAVLRDAGVSYNSAWVRYCPAGMEDGQDTARELLTACPELTGLFCYNDLVAVGALRACAELGYRVPNDLAVVGFDDILLAAMVSPSLTTCRVPRYELGTEAMRLLLSHVSSRTGECEEVVLKPELVIRASAP